MAICVGDWMRLRCGDRVCTLEGRHIGRVEAIFHGAYARVRWDDSRWIEQLELRELRRARRDEE